MRIKIDKQIFNRVYLPYLHNNERILIFYGGAGSGKSYFVVQRYVYLLLLNPRKNLLVVRKTAASNRDSTFALFCHVLQHWGIAKYCKLSLSCMRITFPLGNEVLFKGLDDSEKLKSLTFKTGELTDIWMEEATEAKQSDFNQLNLRLRGGKQDKQIVLTFNPIYAGHWIKTELIDKMHVCALKTTYRDNKFLERTYCEVLEGYKDTDPYYYTVYCLGNWGVTGRSVFDMQSVYERLQEKIPYTAGTFAYVYAQGQIASWKFVKTPGNVKVYAPPEPSRPYVIGADTAGEGSDRFVAQVVDCQSGAQVAVYALQNGEDEFSKGLYCLGKYYNDALIAVECNFSTYVSMELRRLGYINQYIREKIDGAARRKVRAVGFVTNAANRPVMLSLLHKKTSEDMSIINDRTTLEEMLTFVRDENGRAGAVGGAHDDFVMSLAIAHFALEQALERSCKPAQETTAQYAAFSALKPKKSETGAQLPVV